MATEIDISHIIDEACEHPLSSRLSVVRERGVANHQRDNLFHFCAAVGGPTTGNVVVPQRGSGDTVSGPNGQDSPSYWIEQADTSWEQLQRAVRSQLVEGNEDA